MRVRQPQQGLNQPCHPSTASRPARRFEAGGKTYTYYSIPEAEKNGLASAAALPFSMKVILENLLRYEDDRSVKKADIAAAVGWLEQKGKAEVEIAFRPARVLMQGLHRRSGGGRSGRHARRHGGAGR